MKNSSRFFENRECRYFPCHEGQEPLNCLFCYCPFYLKEKCPGNPTWLKLRKKNGEGSDAQAKEAVQTESAEAKTKGAAQMADAGPDAQAAKWKIIKDCTYCTFPHKPENYDVIIDWIRQENETRVFSEEIREKAIEL